MTARTPAWTSHLVHPAFLPTLVLIGGAVHGFAARILETWHLSGLGVLLMGLTPFDVLTAGVGAWLLWTGTSHDAAADRQSPLRSAPELLAVSALLIPSSTLAWCVVALYGAWHARRSTGPARSGALLLVGLALCGLWSAQGLRLVGLPITSLEAGLVATLLEWVRPGVALTGNVVGYAGEHQLIILTACSTAAGLPKALIGIVAVALLAGGIARPRLGAALAGMALLYTIANLLRLALMASSAAHFELAHGPIGANVFDTLMTLGVLALGSWASAPGPAEPRIAPQEARPT